MDVLGFRNKWKIRDVPLGEKPGLGLERSQENEFLFPQGGYDTGSPCPCRGSSLLWRSILHLSCGPTFYLNVPPSVSRLGSWKVKVKTTPFTPLQNKQATSSKPNPMLPRGSCGFSSLSPSHQEVDSSEVTAPQHSDCMSRLNLQSTLPGTTPERDLGCCFLAFCFVLFYYFHITSIP